MKKPYKYAHIFYHYELNFSKRVIQFIQQYQIENGIEENKFFTPFESVYEAFKESSNIELLKVKNPRSAEAINIVGKYADWIFLHNIGERKSILKIRPSYLKKIIWRTWGGDRILIKNYSGNILRRGKNKVINEIIRFRIKRFKAIGVSNLIDEIELSKSFGRLNFVRMPYSSEFSYSMLMSIKQNIKKKECVNIMIGHSAFEEDKHIEITNMLDCFRDRNIRLYYVISYGNQEYKKKLKKYACDSWKEKAVFIEEYMSSEEYAKFLADMDIAFLTAPYSNALGNIGLLLFFDKKIFLDKNGIIAQGFLSANVPFFDYRDIVNMDYEEFICPVDYSNADKDKLSYPKNYNINEKWDLIFNMLEGKD